MLDLLLWPVSASVQLIYSSLTLVVSAFVWVFLSLLPQLLGALLSVSTGFFLIVGSAAPVLFNGICTTVLCSASVAMSALEVMFSFSVAAVEVVGAVVVGLFASLWTGCQIGGDLLLIYLPLLGRWLVSSSLSAGEILFSFSLAATTVIWGAMTTLFAYVWIGCQSLWTFLSMLLLTLGGWAGEAAYLTAQAGGTVVEYISSLPWKEWVAGTLDYAGTFLNGMAEWIDGMGNSVSSGEPHEAFLPESPQDSSVLPSWQQIIGLALAALALILGTEYIVRRFMNQRQRIREAEDQVIRDADNQVIHEAEDQVIREADNQMIHEAEDQVIREDHRPEETHMHETYEEVDLHTYYHSYQPRSLERLRMPERRQRPLAPASRRTRRVQEAASDGSELQRRMRELSASLEREKERSLCVVCLDKDKEVLLRPCNHYCVCSHCLGALGHRCPMCRKRFMTSERVFHA